MNISGILRKKIFMYAKNLKKHDLILFVIRYFGKLMSKIMAIL